MVPLDTVRVIEVLHRLVDNYQLSTEIRQLAEEKLVLVLNTIREV